MCENRDCGLISLRNEELFERLAVVTKTNFYGDKLGFSALIKEQDISTGEVWV